MKLNDLCFSYPGKPVIDHLSLSLPDQGVTALVGPSGCGKTTLLRLMARLEQPQSGTVEGPGPDQIAMLFQEDRLLPGLSARAQIDLIRPQGLDSLHWLRAVGLEGEAEQDPASFSGGMRRRLALARCLAYGQDKSLLLLDEPFTGVDAERIQSLIALIRGMKIPVIFTAHDAESLQMADERFLLKNE